jgi:hypothetical protein
MVVYMPPKRKPLDIDKAIKKPDSFSNQAKRAGFKSTAQYAKFVLDPKNKDKTTETTKRRARFSQTLAKMRKKKK